MSFANFLKEYEPEVYAEYAMEIFGRDTVGKRGSVISKESFKETIDKDKRFAVPEHTQRISDLDDSHPAKRYILQRQIPTEHHSHLYYTDNFQTFVSNYENKEVSTTARIIIPLYDKEYNLIGFQGRSMPWNVGEVRYITIKMVETFPKIYGLHRMNNDWNIVYVVEGPFDAMFLNNTIAMMGSNVDHEDVLRFTKKKDIVYILDNEPRSKDIQRKLKDLISNERKVVIWPEYIKEKDINEMILSGYTKEQIHSIIKENTASGIKAEALYSEWRR